VSILDQPAARPDEPPERHDASGAACPEAPGATALPLPTPQVVVFDLDYTLLCPSDQFDAGGYVRTGARFGLALDPALWPQAERAAYKAVAARREETGLVHDDHLLRVIARSIIEGLGGGPAGPVELTTRAIIEAWSAAENFGLYDDVRPCLETLRAAGVRMALLSNALGHGVEEIVAHFALDDYMAAAVSSFETGAVKPARRMFSTLFGLLGVSPADAVMVGDSMEDDVSGALACGCPAILLDRSGRRRDLAVPRIESLAELPAALGL
jgi:HAD superfamily hydrolase (TIGR01549 family)